MSELRIILRERLWASKEEIINFIDNSLESTFNLEDMPPDIGFPVEGFTGKYGITKKQVFKMESEKNLDPLQPGLIREHTFWEGYTWIKVCYYSEGDGPFSRQERYCGHVKLFPVMGNDKLTDVEVGCGWSLYQPDWEWISRRLHRMFGRPIPVIGRFIFRKPPEEFENFIRKFISSEKRPNILKGLSFSIVKSNKDYLCWSETNKEDESERIKVDIEATDGETLLTIFGLEEPWARLNWLWELLYDNLDKQKLVKVIQSWPGNRILKKPGRKKSKEDIWAWEQVNQFHRDSAEVWNEWKEKVKSRHLVDPERQFKRIIHPRWMTKS